MSKLNSVNVKDYTELYSQYDWFSRNCLPVVQQVSDEFFLPCFQFILLGISKNINTLLDKDPYFVTKVRIDKQHDMFFRLSENTVNIILDRTLGKSNGKFNLNKLTDLEAKIITAFNDFMYNSLAQFLSPAPPTLKRTNFDVIHLTFLLKDIDKGVSGKFIVTLPEVLLNPDNIEASTEKFKDMDFASSLVDVGLKVGTTKIKLIDIKNIDIDDIVVFDNSDTHHMVLKFNDLEKDINLNPNLGLVIPFDNNEGDSEMGENTNLWDSIEVEMNAQFDTVKISLGELKRIEEGLVVDLTSIYNNSVTLSVEDKPIARGELVIVNDRYGVKISEVIADTQTSATTEDSDFEGDNQDFQDDNEQSEEQYQEENPVDSNETQNEEEEFDYSDFELEDEDI